MDVVMLLLKLLLALRTSLSKHQVERGSKCDSPCGLGELATAIHLNLVGVCACTRACEYAHLGGFANVSTDIDLCVGVCERGSDCVDACLLVMGVGSCGNAKSLPGYTIGHVFGTAFISYVLFVPRPPCNRIHIGKLRQAARGKRTTRRPPISELARIRHAASGSCRLHRLTYSRPCVCLCGCVVCVCVSCVRPRAWIDGPRSTGSWVVE